MTALQTASGSQASLAWDGARVTYAVDPAPLHRSDPDWRYAQSGRVDMSAEAEAAAREAFALWDDIVAIDLVEAGGAGADITMRRSTATQGLTFTDQAAAGPGMRGDAALVGADIWLSASWATLAGGTHLAPGGYGRHVYLHEIGHALGLTHPGAYNGHARAEDAAHAADSRAFTVMSYFDAGSAGTGADHAGPEGHVYGATPLLHDILAAQALYGADWTTRTGDTTYGFNATAGRAAFAFAADSAPVVAIWDAGGRDRLDLSGWSMAQAVDLRPGALSSVGGLELNLAIAEGTLIEVALGGAGSDNLAGNWADNMLSGGAGADRLLGRHGADRLLGGAGGDQLSGGAGADRLLGEAGWDQVFGGAGDDRLAGGAGDDRLYGGRGDDSAAGGAGNDRLAGGAGDDRLAGGDGRDGLWAGPGDDWLVGGAGNDILAGGRGADTFEFAGWTGRDRIVDFDPAVDRLRVTGDVQLRDTDAGARVEVGSASVLIAGVAVDELGPAVFDLL